MFMISAPVMYVLFGIKPVIAEMTGYLVALLPYVVFNLLTFTRHLVFIVSDIT